MNQTEINWSKMLFLNLSKGRRDGRLYFYNTETQRYLCCVMDCNHQYELIKDVTDKFDWDKVILSGKIEYKLL
jgi:hypothetical protein